MNGEDRIEKVCKANAMRLGHEPEEMPVGVEAPRPTSFDDFEPWLIVTIEDFIGDAATWVAIHERERVRAMPLDIDYGYSTVRTYAADGGIGLQIFQLHLEF